jgi:hypothetical protein
MGHNMVYRYRPMRLYPKMTTSEVMPKGSFCVWGHYEGIWGASTGNAMKTCRERMFLRHYIATGGKFWYFLQI